MNEELLRRAERAEAEVKRLSLLFTSTNTYRSRLGEEIALADRLAEALQEIRRNSTCLEMHADPALAAWEEAREKG